MTKREARRLGGLHRAHKLSRNQRRAIASQGGTARKGKCTRQQLSESGRKAGLASAAKRAAKAADDRATTLAKAMLSIMGTLNCDEERAREVLGNGGKHVGRGHSVAVPGGTPKRRGHPTDIAQATGQSSGVERYLEVRTLRVANIAADTYKRHTKGM